MRSNNIVDAGEGLVQSKDGGFLRAERVVIRHVPRPSNMVTNPKHVLYGGMAETAIRVFVVPKLSSGRYAAVLTDEEQSYLEEVMGLERNALSIHRKEHNFWDDDNTDGVSRVLLHKQDNYLDLSSPEDYIRYKILLANTDFIAPSLKDLEDHPKATYQYVIIHENEEAKSARVNMSNTMRCYKEYGKVEENEDVLKYLVEVLSGRAVSDKTRLELLQVKVNEYIQANPKRFLQFITDPGLRTKVLIRKALKAGHVTRKGDYYYLRSDGKPLCDEGQDPTLRVAADYLNNPKHQDVMLTLQALLNKDIK